VTRPRLPAQNSQSSFCSDAAEARACWQKASCLGLSLLYTVLLA